MPLDFYGYNRAKAGEFIMSSDYASLYFSNSPTGNPDPSGKAGLIQSVSVAYQHNVQARFEAGSSELFWLTGQSQGSVAVGRLVGQQGILNGVVFGNAPGSLRKGVLGGVEIKLGRNDMEPVDLTLKQQVLLMSGCVLQGIGISFGVGGFDVQESMTIQAALMQQSAP